MPELPEVETVRRGLAPVLEGAVIEKAITRRAGLRFPFPADFSKRLEGNKILQLRRRSKYILIECADGLVVILHLGMSGRVTIYKDNLGKDGEPPTIGKHDHVSLITKRGDHIIYTDPRRFGIITFGDLATIDQHPLLKNIGPEPLGNQFNARVLHKGLTGKKASIKAMLLDQKLVAGLGNIYVCEALWRAGIDPTRKAGSINGGLANDLVPIIRDILTEAIKAGGSSLKDYAQTDGELGYFQHSFKVYGREGEACSKKACGGTVARIAQSGRSTFFCPKCQR
jgi:formamidopyrimidine-DNA glycosylase